MPNEKGIAHLLTLLLVLAGIVVGVYLVSHPEIFNPKASNQIFLVGANLESAPSYGYSDLRPNAPSSNIGADLTAVQAMRGSLVRVFVANDKINDQEAARRLGVFLDKAAQYNIQVIADLIDFYGSGHNPQGTDHYYTDSYNGIPLLNDQFFATGYKDEYFSFIKTVVQANKDKPNIFAWEIGNELKDDHSSSNFINFMQDTSSLIRGLNPGRSVATGMIYSGHADLTPDKLYSTLPDVDVITVHPYNGSHDGSLDVRWAIENGKKAIVEEIGFSGTDDRSQKYKDAISFWQQQGAQGVLVWGFIAKGISDNGDGDRDVGMDSIWHSDYDQLVGVLSSFSTLPVPSPSPSPSNTVVSSPSPSATSSPSPTVVASASPTSSTPISTPSPAPSQSPIVYTNSPSPTPSVPISSPTTSIQSSPTPAANYSASNFSFSNPYPTPATTQVQPPSSPKTSPAPTTQPSKIAQTTPLINQPVGSLKLLERPIQPVNNTQETTIPQQVTNVPVVGGFIKAISDVNNALVVAASNLFRGLHLL